jgi:hypothetical protein
MEPVANSDKDMGTCLLRRRPQLVLRLDYNLASVAKAFLYASRLLSNDVSVPSGLPRFGGARDRLHAIPPRASGSERGHAVPIKPGYERVDPLYFISETHRHSVRILFVLEGSSAQAVTARLLVENPPLGTDASPESRSIEDARVIPWGEGRVCQS